MSGVYSVAAADIAKAQQFPALINKFEVREHGGDASQWQSIGRIEAGTLNFEPRSQTSAGGVPNQLGWMATFTVNGLVTGDNLRTALAEIVNTASEARLTDVNGHAYTLSKQTNEDIDWQMGDVIEGDGEGTKKFAITGGGFVTKATYLSLFATT